MKHRAELGELEMILTQNIHNIIRVPCKWGGIRCRTMRLQENRGLAKHGSPSFWLAESDPDRCNFVRDGRAIPPAFSVPYWLP